MKGKSVTVEKFIHKSGSTLRITNFFIFMSIAELLSREIEKIHRIPIRVFIETRKK